MQDHPVHFLVAANIGMEAVHKFIESWTPIFTALVTIGQVAVATVTVIYVIRKIRLLKKASNEKNPNITVD